MNATLKAPRIAFDRGTLLRVAVSFTLVAIVLARVGPRRALSSLSRLRPEYLAVGLALVVLAVLVSAVQWRLILRSQGVGVGLSTTTALYFVGLFFNNFLPSSIGGDVARVWTLSRKTGKSDEAAASVIADRIFGAIGLSFIALAALVVGFSRSRTYWLPVLAVAVGSGVLVVAATRPRLIARTMARTFGESARATERVSDVARHVRSAVVDKYTALSCAALSVGFQLIVIAINVVILRGLGLKVALVNLLFIVPVISAVSALPISLNGLGVREAAYVYLLGGLGIEPAAAALVSLVFFVMVAAASLTGGIVLMTTREGDK